MKPTSICATLLTIVAMLTIFPSNTLLSQTTDRFVKTLIVDNSRNPQTLVNYQVSINVTYDSHMQSDFEDLRFAWYNETLGQEVQIDYWLDKYVASKYALVWVEIPLIKGLGQEVLYMHYGDPNATSDSNGKETFPFFDDFSIDTTADYEIWRSTTPVGNSVLWNPNGWLVLNVSASTPSTPGSASNVNMRHKTALINATEEKYWLETNAKASGPAFLDHFGVWESIKRDSTPDEDYSLFAVVSEYPFNLTTQYNSSYVGSLWGEWIFVSRIPISSDSREKWYRIGLGTSSTGTVYGTFCDENYTKIVTIANQTVHQNNEWWVGFFGSRMVPSSRVTELYVYLDYLRVRKFTEPEPEVFELPQLLKTYRRMLQGDINGDGKIDILDLALVAKRFGKTIEGP